jgi:hypothetical protein
MKGIKLAEVNAKGMGVRAASPSGASGEEMQSYRSVTFKVVLPGLTGRN